MYTTAAIVVMRFGLLSLAIGTFVFNLVDFASARSHLTPRPGISRPEYGGAGEYLRAAAAWAFYTSSGGRGLFSGDFFD